MPEGSNPEFGEPCKANNAALFEMYCHSPRKSNHCLTLVEEQRIAILIANILLTLSGVEASFKLVQSNAFEISATERHQKPTEHGGELYRTFIWLREWVVTTS